MPSKPHTPLLARQPIDENSETLSEKKRGEEKKKKLQSKKVFLSLAPGRHHGRIAVLLVDIKRLAEGLPTSWCRWPDSDGTF